MCRLGSLLQFPSPTDFSLLTSHSHFHLIISSASTTKNNRHTMPKVAPASVVRRSTRSPVPPSSGSNNGSLSPDATAFQLLKSQLENEEWRILSSRKGGFDALVKKGHALDDAGELCLYSELSLDIFLLSIIGCPSLARSLALSCASLFSHVSCHVIAPLLSCTLFYFHANMIYHPFLS
jgi:hypothetical protein